MWISMRKKRSKGEVLHMRVEAPAGWEGFKGAECKLKPSI